MFHDKTEVSIKESHRHRHDKMSYEVKEKHHGGHIGVVPPVLPGAGLATPFAPPVLPVPVAGPAGPAGRHDKFSLKIKEKVSRRPATATTTTTTTATPAGMVSETITNGPFIAPAGGFGMPSAIPDGIMRSPAETTYVYHDAPTFTAPDVPPVTTTYIVHEPVLPVGSPAAFPAPAPIPISPMATALPTGGKHELKIKEKFRGRHGAAGATLVPIPEFGAPLVPPPTAGKHEKFQFRLKEKHRA